MNAAEALLPDATRTVLGIATAKIGGNESDAALLLNCYMADAAQKHQSPADAWAVLFSASASWFTAMLEHHAAATRQPASAVVRTLAYNLERNPT